MTKIRILDCPNKGDRRGGVQPTMLILHYTGTATGEDAEQVYMSDPPHPVFGSISPHYMIDTNGDITQFVDESKRAHHAGESWWDGETDINSHSIGIELVNPGHLFDYPDFPAPQMQALAELARLIIARNAIPPHRVLGHSDIVPARTPQRWKPDPGEKFAWDWLAAQGIGLWPQPQQDDFDMASALYPDEAALRQAMTDYGYDPRVTFEEVVTSFQRHFQPEVFAQKRSGRADAETGAKLHKLLHMKNSYGLPEL